MDTHRTQNVITGGMDNRIFLWNLNKKALSIYNSTGCITDCIHSISEDTFVTTCEDAKIELWSNSKNKPRFVFPKTHFSDFICSLTGVSDLLASGATDNFINLHKFNE